MRICKDFGWVVHVNVRVTHHDGERFGAKKIVPGVQVLGECEQINDGE